MSDEDVVGDAIERLEWDERKQEDSPSKKWRQLTRRTALTGGAAAIAAVALEACGSSKSTTSQAATSSGRWSPVLLPPPRAVAEYLWDALRDGTLLDAAGVTLQRLLAGYAIGIAMFSFGTISDDDAHAWLADVAQDYLSAL